MNMFGLEGSGFIIAISVSLLLVGAVVYYFNARVATLEKGLAAQSHVLQGFITNVRGQLTNAAQGPVMGGAQEQNTMPPANGATAAAMEAAQEWSESKPRSLVAVSDGEDNEDKEDNDSDSEESGSSLDDSDDEDDDSGEDDDEDDEEDSDDDNHAINLGSSITDSSLEGLLGVDSITVMKVDPMDQPAVAMMMQAINLDGNEVVDLTTSPQITEITDESTQDKKQQGTDEAVNEISLGDLDNMDSLDNTVDGSNNSNDSLDSNDDDLNSDEGDVATADTNTSIPTGTDFSQMRVPHLKKLARSAGIVGYSTMKKAVLISALETHNSQ